MNRCKLYQKVYDRQSLTIYNDENKNNYNKLKLKFHFIGTSAGSPTVERNVTSLAITFEQRSNWYMVDCGDGTQQRILRTSLSLPRLKKVFVTHMHGDHIYGLPGILTSRGLMCGADSEIEIYGPKGIKEYIQTVLKLSYTRVHYPIKIHEFHQAGELYENENEIVSTVALSHDIPSYAYVLKEKSRPGTFDVEKAKAAGIPPGPLFGQLTAGKTIKVDGKEFSGKDFIGPEKKGRTVIIGGDNDSPQLLSKELKNACLLIHESTHTEVVRENLKWNSKHSTAHSVGTAAEKAGLKNLILTHFSPRFSLCSSPDQPHSIENVKEEAESVYSSGDLFLARDGDIYKLDRDEKVTLDYRRQRRRAPSTKN